MSKNAHPKSKKNPKIESLDWLDDSAETRNAFRSVVDGHAIIVVTDTSGVITHVNDRFCEVSKYSRKEVEGKTHRIVNSEYHDEAFFADLWTTIISGKIWHGEIRNRAKDGSFFWVDTTIFPEMSRKGEPVRYFAILTDITRLKSVEEELRNEDIEKVPINPERTGLGRASWPSRLRSPRRRNLCSRLSIRRVRSPVRDYR